MDLPFRRIFRREECARLVRGHGDHGIIEACAGTAKAGVTMSGAGSAPAGAASAVFGLAGR